MASAFFKGGRWFARFKDEDGKWRSRATDQPTGDLATEVARALAARAERVRLGIDRPPSPLCGPLMKTWSLSLTNRSYRDDIGRLERHVLPRFETLPLDQVTLAEVMRWLDDMKRAREISPGTQRHCLNVLSRFLSWAVKAGLLTENTCRLITDGARPRSPRKLSQVGFVDDIGLIHTIRTALHAPFGLMFYVGNQAGLRLGEIAGLRLSDFECTGGQALRVRYCYSLPLNTRGSTAPRVHPCDEGLRSRLGPWIASRRAEGATDESFLFVAPNGGHFTREQVTRAWHPVRKALGLGRMTFSDATTVSFSRRMERRNDKNLPVIAPEVAQTILEIRASGSYAIRG